MCTLKNAIFYYTRIETDLLDRKRHKYVEHVKPIEVSDCLKQILLQHKLNSKEIMPEKAPFRLLSRQHKCW